MREPEQILVALLAVLSVSCNDGVATVSESGTSGDTPSGGALSSGETASGATAADTTGSRDPTATLSAGEESEGSAESEGSTGSPGEAQRFCPTFGAARTYCNDLSDPAVVEGDEELLNYDQFSGGNQTSSWLAEGYWTPQIVDDGALRFTLHDGPQNDMGMQGPLSGAELPSEIHMAFVVRFAADFFVNNGKFLMFEATTAGAGWRPTVLLRRIVDSRGDVRPAGDPYYVFLLTDDAAGLGSDEFGYEYPQDAYTDGLVHELRLDDYVDQWVFIEFVAVQDGEHELYVATPDGRFDGSTPVMRVASRTTPTSMPWHSGRVNAYSSDLAGTTSESHMDVDLFQIDGERIGPPPGFFD